MGGGVDVDERAFPDRVEQANDVLIAQATQPCDRGVPIRSSRSVPWI